MTLGCPKSRHAHVKVRLAVLNVIAVLERVKRLALKNDDSLVEPLSWTFLHEFGDGVARLNPLLTSGKCLRDENPELRLSDLCHEFILASIFRKSRWHTPLDSNQATEDLESPAHPVRRARMDHRAGVEPASAVLQTAAPSRRTANKVVRPRRLELRPLDFQSSARTRYARAAKWSGARDSNSPLGVHKPKCCQLH